MEQVTTYLKDYQSVPFEVVSIDLDVALYENKTIVINTMVLHRRGLGPLRLCGEDLELVGIQLNHRELLPNEYRFDGQDLVFDDCPDELMLVITTIIYPSKNTKLSGLYRSHDIFCTQCEAEGFRRITYFYDRPDVLTCYTTRISADKANYPVLLSNGNLIDSGDAADGRHWVLWQDPFKKPSYLFALVAGKLDCYADQFVTASGRHVDLHLYVEPGKTDRCAHAMVSLKNAMRWDEEKYGREYDLSIMMIVAVSDFNSGAMENKGLNIFNDQYILARPDTATDWDYAHVESVVGHEYFHNWTGNRVTCRDWFQLSLKEGLTVFREQSFAGDMNDRDVNRIVDVKTLRSIQFPEDAGRMAHPVRPESYQEISNFYTATIYNKGAEVIRMQHTLLGEKRFRQAMDLYFERYDGQAVTIDDFVAAMEDVGSIDLTQFKRWYSQAGTPVVDVESTYQNETLKLTLSQSCAATPECVEKKPFHIPIEIAMFDQQGQMIPLERPLLELREPSQTFCFEHLKEEPVVSLLRGFSAPIILKYSQSEQAKLMILKHETDGFAKWEAAQTLMSDLITRAYTSDKAVAPSDAFLHAFSNVLNDDHIDFALRSELLTPPTYEHLANGIVHVDVTRLEDARDGLQRSLGQHLYPQLLEMYDFLWSIEDHQMTGKAFGRRSLRNFCLGLMMKANERLVLSRCIAQFNQAQTMTDQFASLVYLAACQDESSRKMALSSFYQQWQHEELVIDKWFGAQAIANRPSVLDEVRHLTTEAAFNLMNPNRVRALIGRFCQGNPRYFHALDGSGYHFLVEILEKVDKMNPHLAARLATPLTRWMTLDIPRQQLIQSELKHLSMCQLSKGLAEVVHKSLAK